MQDCSLLRQSILGRLASPRPTLSPFSYPVGTRALITGAYATCPQLRRPLERHTCPAAVMWLPTRRRLPSDLFRPSSERNARKPKTLISCVCCSTSSSSTAHPAGIIRHIRQLLSYVTQYSDLRLSYATSSKAHQYRIGNLKKEEEKENHKRKCSSIQQSNPPPRQTRS